ncbi:hypothetical protein [Bradyrhizobium erythrophlei]|uniref:Uncharacterized protein n=1 Tax=Bradyrhizobium erythrophlei TaxID=1437360 RepID=A0A1M5NIQ2_9BRAD|nr:hypothetical protein [Bradyrhizobium erythrophlei]SHG89401.1 hypothetical protein SAMN05443248_3012 [Bradyrhizobium erythrophlei]
MAGTRTNYTIHQARAILAKHGMTIKSVDGEYIVNFKGAKTETSAYYATNLLDAIGTGIDMAERKAIKLVVAGEVVPDMEIACAHAAEIFMTTGVVVAIEYV